MKTTLDLPDDLLIEAKTAAARRRTTLKAVVESALRRELAPAAPVNPDPKKFETGPFGILRLKKRPGAEPVTPEMIRAIQDELDEEEFKQVMNPRQP